MARNKNPEETANLIIEVSLKLFLEQGYEETTIQDIIDNLGGLSKGAIYHHFKSKEEILEVATNRVEMENIKMLAQIKNDPTLTGIEKLKRAFIDSLSKPNQELVFKIAPVVSKNPRFLAMQIQDIIDVVVPQFIQPIVEQCIEEGTIKTGYARELSEVLILLANMWMNPLVFSGNTVALGNRMRFYSELLAHMNINLVDEAMIDLYIKSCENYEKYND